MEPEKWEAKYIEIVKRGLLKQKYYARFIGANGKVLAWTEHYNNLADLETMLGKYFPDWRITVDRVS
jgi:uncharacterized protein YegP (UPF0339 family)